MRNQLLWVLVFISIITYFTGLGFVRQVIFDEVHFGKFITSYCCSHQRIFDIHPPHGKLITASIAKLGGYDGGFSFDSIGQQYGSQPVIALRLVSTLFGAFIPALAYILLRQMKVRPPIALLGGLALVFDNAFVTQARLIALDSMLIASTLAALIFFLAASRTQLLRHARWLFVACGLAAGLAAGMKFTGLTVLGVVGVATLWRLVASKTRAQKWYWLQSGIIILLSALAIYLAGWWLHFALLTQPGDGDAWGLPTGFFWKDVIDIHHTMLDANYNLTATHPYSSSWWTWPGMQRSIFYWSSDQGAGIYFLGNPVVWWGADLLFAAALISLLLFPEDRQKVMREDRWILLIGYFISFAPFMRVPRALFLYHYLTPLLFSLLFGLVWLHTRLETKGRRSLSWKMWYALAIVLVISSFLYFSPLTYGFLVSSQWQQSLFWLPGWR